MRDQVPAIKVLLLPKDTNAYGTIFGGVILSNIDLASAVEARRVAPRRFVTKAMREVEFHEPVFVGDVVNFFAETVRVGRTSVTVRVSVEAERWGNGQTGAGRGEDRTAEDAVLRGFTGPEAKPGDVGFDLIPEDAAGAASHRAHFAQMNARLSGDLDVVAQRKGCPFQNRADDSGFGSRQRQPEQHAGHDQQGSRDRRRPADADAHEHADVHEHADQHPDQHAD